MFAEVLRTGPYERCCRCVHQNAALEIAAGVGPRIVSFGFHNGANVLYNDTSGFAIGDWKLYGGHRFCIAPETSQTYEPDNEPCELVAEPNLVRVTAAPSSSHLQKSIEIAPAAEVVGFEVRHTLRNLGTLPAHVAPWAITCLSPVGQVVASWGSGTTRWRTNMIRFWSQTGAYPAQLDPPYWRFKSESLIFEPNGEQIKFGWFSELGWIALSRPDGTFLKMCRPVASESSYPDGGCNLELYSCKKYIEFETLGPLLALLPKEIITHTELWSMLPFELGARASCMSLPFSSLAI